MRDKKWAALGAALSLTVAAWRWYTDESQSFVVVEEVKRKCPDRTFPWGHLDSEGNVPQEWVAEHLGYLLANDKSSGFYYSDDKTTAFIAPALRLPRHPTAEQVTFWEAPYKQCPDWPKNHVAFSSIPGIGRPLEWQHGKAVLNGPWEADPEEKAFREARKEWQEKLRALKARISGTGLSQETFAKIEKGELPFSVVFENLKTRQSSLTRAKKAAKELEPLIGSAPKHPSTL